MRLLLYSCLGLLLVLYSCDEPSAHTLEELRSNHYNALQLPVKPALEAEGFEAIFEQYQALDQTALEEYLSSTPLELHEASFGLYYLANAQAANRDMEGALQHHLAAATHYLNPLSYLKLAEREFFATQAYDQAYFYLHHALEILVEITDNNRSHPLSRGTREKAQYLLEELDNRGDQGVFDKAAIRAKLKATLPDVVQQYRTLYQLDSEAPS